jgi:hypothetical protein
MTFYGSKVSIKLILKNCPAHSLWLYWSYKRDAVRFFVLGRFWLTCSISPCSRVGGGGFCYGFMVNDVPWRTQEFHTLPAQEQDQLLSQRREIYSSKIHLNPEDPVKVFTVTLNVDCAVHSAYAAAVNPAEKKSAKATTKSMAAYAGIGQLTVDSDMDVWRLDRKGIFELFMGHLKG